MPRTRRARPSPTQSQLTLIPDTPPTALQADVPLTWLPADPDTQVDANFVESVRRFGVLQPVALRAPRTIGELQTVVDGRRRVAAARLIGLETIPALIFPASVPIAVIAAMTLTANTQRSRNPLAELEAIERLAREGASEQQISEQLHIPLPTIRSRLRLQRLIDPAVEAVRCGTLSYTLAERMAGLAPAMQQAALTMAASRAPLDSADWHVRAADIAEARRVQLRANQTEAPLFPERVQPQSIDAILIVNDHEIAVYGVNYVSQRYHDEAMVAMSMRALDVSQPSTRVEVDFTNIPEDGGWDTIRALVRAAIARVPAEASDDVDNIVYALSAVERTIDVCARRPAGR